MARGLTRRQQEALRFVRDYLGRSGFPPTVRELAAHLRSTPKAALGHLRALERKGQIHRHAGKRRAIELTGGASAESGGASRSEAALLARVVPIVEQVPPEIPDHDGSWPTMEQYSSGRVTVDSRHFQGMRVIAVPVRGPGLPLQGILQRDLALVEVGARRLASPAGAFVSESGALDIAPTAEPPQRSRPIGPVVGIVRGPRAD